MKTEQEINADILAITMVIRKTYPELSKFIDEMPVTIPNNADPELNVRSLTSYYDSLKILLKEYAANHKSAMGKNIFEE